MDLNSLLDEISVEDPSGKDENTPSWPEDWWGVSDETGIIAYFGHEADAFNYRLFLINMRLNGENIVKRYT